MPTNLSIRAKNLEEIDVLLVTGEIDVSTAARLAQALVEHAEGGVPSAPLVADLTEVPFMDSTGARILALAGRAATGRGAELLIVPSQFVAHVLEVTGLVTVLQVYPELSTALEAARDLTAGGAVPGRTRPEGGRDA